jgi:uncharacterized protein YndB with AHSA1/START domain
MSTITITRTVAATPEAAWRAWTDPGEVARWWWPHLPDTTYEWAPAEGAAYRIESAEAGLGVHGVFTHVVAPRLLACTWVWHSDQPNEDPEDTVEVSFESEGEGKTVVTVRHSSLAHVEGGGARRGWNDVMDRLAALT